MNLVYIFFKRVYFYLELIKQTLIKKNYKIFYSQFGEDRIINELLKKNKKGFQFFSTFSTFNKSRAKFIILIKLYKFLYKVIQGYTRLYMLYNFI